MHRETPRETTNNVFETVLHQIGGERRDLVVVDADLQRASQTKQFSDAFPDRHFDVGIAEQNMACIAAGLSLTGRPVIISTFAVFLSKRICDQVSIEIAYSNTNVKLIAIEAGLSSGRNGATHQAVQDLAIMRSMPNMTVMAPADAVEISAAVKAAVDYVGPVYMRMQRGEVPHLFDASYSFEWGKGVLMEEGADVAILSTGIMTERALDAAAALRNDGIRATVAHFHTIKPLDTELVVELAERHAAIVTAENHSIVGGLGGAVAEVLAERRPTLMRRVGIRDMFGETGSPEYLNEKYGLRDMDIAEVCRNVVKERRTA